MMQTTLETKKTFRCFKCSEKANQLLDYAKLTLYPQKTRKMVNVLSFAKRPRKTQTGVKSSSLDSLESWKISRNDMNS